MTLNGQEHETQKGLLTLGMPMRRDEKNEFESSTPKMVSTISEALLRVAVGMAVGSLGS